MGREFNVPTIFTLSIVSSFLILAVDSSRLNPFIQLPSDRRTSGSDDDVDSVGTRWAVLVAGSSGYGNYRHQADVCHAYQIMRKGGLKDENIIVFMYDDIADNRNNPRPGVIINHPNGGDVYGGVPKDYIGSAVNVDNFFAVLLGNKTATTGGSGKVVDSGPNDHIFVFYSDHGGPGVLGMPTYPFLYADDLIDVLVKKHASASYKSLVFYLEACESGSIFEGLLPDGMNIYATTASNAYESSWGTYCPGMLPSPPPEYDTCLGDLYSVSWMEDSDVHNLQTESLQQQYRLVKDRTSVSKTYNSGSHVMEYGNIDLSFEHLFLYIGSNPANENYTFSKSNSLPSRSMAVNQRDADLMYYWNKFRKSPEGSTKVEAQRELLDMISHRLHVDKSMELIGKLLFGLEKGTEILEAVRPAGKPLTDDWKCLKTMDFFETGKDFETYCGSLSQYGMKHMRGLANICNAGVTIDMMSKSAAQACTKVPSGPWSSLHRGFSA